MNDPYYDKFKVPGLSPQDNQSLVFELKKLDENPRYNMIRWPWRRERHDALLHPLDWARHDLTIKQYLKEYLERLKPTNVPDIDWKWVRMLLWVETGAVNPDWIKNPIQIGIKGDPGLGVVLGGKEKIENILPSEQRKGLTEESVQLRADLNIKVGIAYLLNRLCESEIISTPDFAAPLETYSVKAGDSLDKIAQKFDSSVAHIQTLNKLGVSTNVSPGQILSVQRVNTGRKITKWKPITVDNIALYNGSGDPLYKSKLLFVQDIMRLAQNYRISNP